MKQIAIILVAVIVAAGCSTVEPSPIQQACYNADYRCLTIEFSDGSRYRYLEVPVLVFEELYASKAKGRYFNYEIRNKFETRKLCAAARWPW